MAKKIISIIIIAVLLLGALPMTAYADDTVTVTVITFEPSNPMYTIEAPMGEPYNAPMPVLTETEDGIFLGWYTDIEYTNRYADGTALYESITLYPRYVPESEIIHLNVYLNPNDQYPVVTALYAIGDLPDIPATPEPEGKEFFGWFADKALKTPFDFDEPMYEDTSVYAKLVAEEDCYTVWLYLSPDAPEHTVAYYVPKGEPMPVPADPGKDGVIFFGWYTDRELTQPADFTSPRSEDVSLFPRFVAEEDCYTVFVYLTNVDTEPVTGFDVPKGDPITEPEAPGREGFDFGGWYTDRELTQPADFTAPRSEDVSLYAKWIPTHGHDLKLIEEVPATATADGTKAHYKCADCGKLFEYLPYTVNEITDPEELVIDAYGPYILGDSDGDGEVTILDATSIQRRLASLPLTRGFCRGAANVDKDGEVSILDATGIQRYLASLSAPEDVGTEVTV